MFCSECGTQIKEGAKFCYNCGAKLKYNLETEKEMPKPVTEKKRNVNMRLVNEYTAYIQNQAFTMYLNGEEVSPNCFYKKAELYDMVEQDVNAVCDKVENTIYYLDRYLDDVFENGHKLYVSDSIKEKFIQYGKTLYLSKDTSEGCWRRYLEKNEFKEKREFFEEVINFYGNTGIFIETVPLVYEKIKTADPQKLLYEYIDKIREIEPLVASQYQENSVEMLSKEQIKQFQMTMEKYGLLVKHAEMFISGYEKKSGIEERRESERRRRVYERLSDLDKVYCFFDRKIKIHGKYYLSDWIKRTLDEPFDYLNKSFDNMSKSSSDAVLQLRELFDEFDVKFRTSTATFLGVLEIPLSDAIIKRYYDILESAYSSVDYLRDKFREIQQKVEENKQLRKEIKDDRGRWQGGGFGVGGAIKGAATAGAMNAATGLAYSGAGLVGSAISNLGASHNRKKSVNAELATVFSWFYKLTKEIYNYYMIEISKYYPEYYFNGNIVDSQKEMELREKIHEGTEDERIEIGYQLLETNPANWRNGIEITSEFIDTLDDETEKALSAMDNHFGWISGLQEEISHLEKVAKEAKEKIDAWELIPEEIIEEIKKLDKIIEIQTRRGRKGEEIESTRRAKNYVLEKAQEISFYYQTLDQIMDIPINDIYEYGCSFYANNEWNKAKILFVKAVNEDKDFEKILVSLCENGDEEKKEAVELLDRFVKQKNTIDEKVYKNALYILARLRNKSEKTLLIYVAQLRNKTVMEELITNGADVSILNYLLDGKIHSVNTEESKKDVSGYKICSNCKKKIAESAKFCNFCGTKC